MRAYDFDMRKVLHNIFVENCVPMELVKSIKYVLIHSSKVWSLLFNNWSEWFETWCPTVNSSFFTA